MIIKVVGFVIVIIWFGVLVFMILVMFVVIVKWEEEIKIVICIEDWLVLLREIYIFILFVIGYVILLFVIIVVYFLVVLCFCRRKLFGY